MATDDRVARLRVDDLARECQGRDSGSGVAKYINDQEVVLCWYCLKMGLTEEGQATYSRMPMVES